jgi:hypothetical protein
MQQACTPDVTRLCSDDVPDLERITVCMKRNRANLGSACGAAMGAGPPRAPTAIIRGVTDPEPQALKILQSAVAPSSREVKESAFNHRMRGACTAATSPA